MTSISTLEFSMMSDGKAINQVIELKGVSKAYDQRLVWRNLDLSFQSNRIYILHGQNGCGKTTLLRLIAGLTAPEGGEIHLQSQKVLSQNRLAQELVSFYQPSQRGLWPSLRVGDNWRLQGTIQQINTSQWQLRLDGLKDFSSSLGELWPHQLSTGYRQIALITKALLKPCPIYLLDEPFAHLDLENSARLKNCLSNLATQGACILLTAQTSDLAALKDLGQIINLEEMAKCT